MKRVLTAVVFLPVFVALVGWAPPWAFAALVAAAAVAGVLEIDGLARRSGWRAHRWIAAAMAAGACAAFLEPARAGERILLLSAACAAGGVLLGLARGAERALGGAAVTLFAAYYPGVLLAYLVGVRAAPGGRRLVFFLFAIVWASDTAAYYLGRALGRHALAPSISPRKTVEGAAAGLAGAAGAALLCRALFLPQIGVASAAPLGLAVGAISIVGDLTVSMFKRTAGLKDSGHLLPGHGGILDRVDSLLLAGPFFYYYHLWAMS
jgi:phosphatidate cytidylyltransferase